MWIPRSPMRPDFCGCVGCPICYVWAEGGSQPIDGIKKMTLDLLGDQKPTPAQKRQLTIGAKLVHANNLARKEAAQQAEQERRDADDAKWAGRSAEAFLKDKAKEMKRPKRKKVDPRPVMDNIGEKELEKRTRIPEPAKAPVLEPLYVGTATAASTTADPWGSNPMTSRISEMYRQMMRDQEKILCESLAMPKIIKAWDIGT